MTETKVDVCVPKKMSVILFFQSVYNLNPLYSFRSATGNRVIYLSLVILTSSIQALCMNFTFIEVFGHRLAYIEVTRQNYISTGDTFLWISSRRFGYPDYTLWATTTASLKNVTFFRYKGLGIQWCVDYCNIDAVYVYTINVEILAVHLIW